MIKIYNMRFGVPENIIRSYNYFHRSDMIWATTIPEDKRPLFGQHFQMQGLRVVRYSPYTIKPTTVGIQFFANHIKKNKVNLNTKMAKELLVRGKINLEKHPSIEEIQEPGYVAIFINGIPVGCAEWKPPTLKHMIPTRRIPDLLHTIEMEDSIQNKDGEEQTCCTIT